MSNFKPQVRVITQESNGNFYNRQANSAFVSIPYPTYKELKKNLKQHLLDNLEPMVSVYRSRRGQWGEWFENWMLVGGEPKIISQGWQ